MVVNRTLRSTIAVVVALLVVIVVIALMPRLVIQPRGVFLPAADMAAGTKLPVQSVEQLRFYTSADAPLSYQALGQLSVVYHTNRSNLVTQRKVELAAAQLAAAAGGNGVIVTVAGNTSAQVPEPLAVEILRGTVILTPGF